MGIWRWVSRCILWLSWIIKTVCSTIVLYAVDLDITVSRCRVSHHKHGRRFHHWPMTRVKVLGLSPNFLFNFAWRIEAEMCIIMKYGITFKQAVGNLLAEIPDYVLKSMKELWVWALWDRKYCMLGGWEENSVNVRLRFILIVQLIWNLL